MQLAVVCVVFGVQVAWILVKLMLAALCWLIPTLLDLATQGWQMITEGIQGYQRKKLMVKAEILARNMSESINALSATDLEELLIHVVSDGGRGSALDRSLEQALEAIEANKAIDRLRILLLALTLGYRSKVQEAALAQLYLTIDSHCVEKGGRTRLQEILLADYAAVNELKLQAR